MVYQLEKNPPVAPDPLHLYRAKSIGAWPELFPHGGEPTEVNGVVMPMHGEVHNRAWNCEIKNSREGSAEARLSVDCHLMPLRLERAMRIGRSGAILTLEETATNYSNMPVEFMWGHHPLFGKPLLSPRSRIFAPARSSRTSDLRLAGWPVHEGRDLAACPAEGAGTGEMFYLDSLTDGWCSLVNQEEKLGVALKWDSDVFPFVWIWREANAARGYPYFGRAYAVAMEPFSSLPQAREHGERLLRLEAGAKLSTRIVFSVFEGLEEVRQVSDDGAIS